MTKTKRQPPQPKPLINPERMTSIQAAEFLGVKEQTLRLWRHEGRETSPPFTRIGGKVIYKQSSLEAWMVRNTVDASLT